MPRPPGHSPWPQLTGRALPHFHAEDNDTSDFTKIMHSEHVDQQRRRTLRGLASLPLLAAGCAGGSGNALAPDAPNVLMIVIDDLNDWVGFLGGHPQVQTPNLDRLAARSSVFTRAYCNAPVCNPSRASFLSGMSPQRTRVFDNATPLATANPEAVELPTHLARRGFKVQLAGKIGHVYAEVAQPLPPATPAANQRCAGGPALPPRGFFDWAPLDVADELMPDYQYAQTGIDFLARPHAAPFFLGVGFVRTHVAWYVPQRYFDLYDEVSIELPPAPPDDLDDLPPAGREVALRFNFHDCITTQGLWRSAVRGYLASISHVDAQVGRLLDALEVSHHAANTSVVLCSDHGWHLGEKFHWHKLALWERATRVPLLVQRPGQSTGAHIDAPVSLLDLVPTVLDLHGGVTPPYALDGRSLLPLLEQPNLAWDHPVLTTKDESDHAIRTAEWRYIRYANGDRELYDERNDPGEFTNLALEPAQQARIAELDALMPPA